MNKVLAALERAGQRLENAALLILLGTMIGLAVLQIVNRQFLGGSIAMPWADELIKLIVLWLAMVGSIAACRDDKHIRIDLISHVLSGPIVAWSRAIVDLFAAGVCAVIAWQAWRLIREEMSWGDTALVDVPVWTLHLIVPLAFALISYRFLVKVTRDIHSIASETSQDQAS